MRGEEVLMAHHDIEIRPDDRIIVNGLMRARPGIVVSPKTEGEAPPQAPAAPPK